MRRDSAGNGTDGTGIRIYTCMRMRAYTRAASQRARISLAHEGARACVSLHDESARVSLHDEHRNAGTRARRASEVRGQAGGGTGSVDGEVWTQGREGQVDAHKTAGERTAAWA